MSRRIPCGSEFLSPGRGRCIPIGGGRLRGLRSAWAAPTSSQGSRPQAAGASNTPQTEPPLCPGAQAAAAANLTPTPGQKISSNPGCRVSGLRMGLGKRGPSAAQKGKRHDATPIPDPPGAVGGKHSFCHCSCGSWRCRPHAEGWQMVDREMTQSCGGFSRVGFTIPVWHEGSH